MPLSMNSTSGVRYVSFDFQKYIESIKKDNSTFAEFEHFDTMTNKWLKLLVDEDNSLKNKEHLKQLIKDEDNRQKLYLSQVNRMNYEVFDHQLNFNFGESYIMHYDIEKIHVAYSRGNVTPQQIDLTNPQLVFNQTHQLKSKLTDNRPIYVSLTPLIGNPYTVIDGNHRCSARLGEGITTIDGYIIENAVNGLMFEIDRLFYKFLYEMQVIHMLSMVGEKPTAIWKNSYIYWLTNKGGIEDASQSYFNNYIDMSFERYDDLRAKEKNKNLSLIQKLNNFFRRS